MNRVHMGCGTVYLRDYINIDIKGEHTFLAAQRPDLVDLYITEEHNYYGRHEDKTIDKLRDGPLEQEYVCDHYGDFLNWDWMDRFTGVIFEILGRHTFEHMSTREARKALHMMSLILPRGGILRLDVPDHEATLERLMETKDKFYIRHLIGPRRDDSGYHVMSYSIERLIALVEEYRFKIVRQEPNIHFYPAFCLRFERV